MAAGYYCSDGGSRVSGCAGPVGPGENIDTATLGWNSFAVQARDGAGNTATKSLSYRVLEDTDAPKASIDYGPDGLTSDATPTFSFGGSDNMTASWGLLYSYRVDGGAWSPYSAGTDATLGGAAGLADGPHTLHVRAKDAAGNEDPAPAERAFLIDTVTPSFAGKTRWENGKTPNPSYSLSSVLPAYPDGWPA